MYRTYFLTHETMLSLKTFISEETLINKTIRMKEFVLLT